MMVMFEYPSSSTSTNRKYSPPGMAVVLNLTWVWLKAVGVKMYFFLEMRWMARTLVDKLELTKFSPSIMN